MAAFRIVVEGKGSRWSWAVEAQEDAAHDWFVVASGDAFSTGRVEQYVGAAVPAAMRVAVSSALSAAADLAPSPGALCSGAIDTGGN